MQGLTERLIHHEIPHNNCIGPTDQFYSKGIVAEIPLYDTVLQLEEYLGHGTKVRKDNWPQLPSDLGTIRFKPPIHETQESGGLEVLFPKGAGKAMAPHSSTLAWKIPWRMSLLGDAIKAPFNYKL